MSLFGDVSGVVKSAIGYVEGARMPHEIVVNYPEGSQARGAEAGRFLLKRASDGAHYVWSETPREYERPLVTADVEINHTFLDLGSLLSFLEAEGDPAPGDDAGTKAIFIYGQPFGCRSLSALLDDLNPQEGSLSLAFQRHPAWVRWSNIVGHGQHKDLDHLSLADLLLDNAEDLEEPTLAQYLAQFRSAKSIEYSADHDTGAAQGLMVRWSGRAGADKTTEAKVPREFAANISAYVGAWPPGEEPTHRAMFRLRVIPPKGEAVTPTFRLTWVNALDYENEAASVLASAVRSKTTLPVYLGEPNVRRYVPVK